MKKFKRIAVTALAVAALGVGSVSVAAAQDAPQGNAANG